MEIVSINENSSINLNQNDFTNIESSDTKIELNLENHQVEFNEYKEESKIDLNTNNDGGGMSSENIQGFDISNDNIISPSTLVNIPSPTNISSSGFPSTNFSNNESSQPRSIDDPSSNNSSTPLSKMEKKKSKNAITMSTITVTQPTETQITITPTWKNLISNHSSSTTTTTTTSTTITSTTTATTTTATTATTSSSFTMTNTPSAPSLSIKTTIYHPHPHSQNSTNPTSNAIKQSTTTAAADGTIPTFIKPSLENQIDSKIKSLSATSSLSTLTIHKNENCPNKTTTTTTTTITAKEKTLATDTSSIHSNSNFVYHIYDLPVEILINIGHLIDMKALGRICRTSKRLCSVYYSTQELWTVLNLSKKNTIGGKK